MFKLGFMEGKLKCLSGDKDWQKKVCKTAGLTPEDVKSWFTEESRNPCCNNPELVFFIQPDTTTGFECLNCNTCRTRKRLLSEEELRELTELPQQSTTEDKTIKIAEIKKPESKITSSAIPEVRSNPREYLKAIYGYDVLLMNPTRDKLFKHFLAELKKKYPVNPNIDGYLTDCISCKAVNRLLINKFTGTTFCYKCRRELPFEYLLEELTNMDILSIIQLILNDNNELYKSIH